MRAKPSVMTRRILSVLLVACAACEPAAPDADHDAESAAVEARSESTREGAERASDETDGAAHAGRAEGSRDAGTSTDAASAPRMGGADAGRADAGAREAGVDAAASAPATTPPARASAEDDGADCAIGALPEASALKADAKLPDPFTRLDGKPIASKSDWRCRREEIKRLAEKFAYGVKPARPAMVSGTVSNTSISVKVSDNGKSASFTASVMLPGSGTAPYPAIIVYGGGGFGAPLDNAVIKSEGVALISYDPYAVGKEGTPRNDKQGAFYALAGNTSTTGLLVAWAWGVSRILDVIEQAGGALLRADAIGVTGCSRFGKGAFLAGAFDQRVALTMPIESGSAGVPIWRGIPGEGAQSLSSAYGEQPWLGDAFATFTSKPSSLPFDTHELVAMLAPRGLFIMDNPHIANLGPKSAHAAALAGAEVYKALGVGDAITYYSDVQNGSHCAQRPEWSTPLKNNIQRFLKRSGSAPGVIKAAAKASSNLSDWRSWQTPNLR